MAFALARAIVPALKHLALLARPLRQPEIKAFLESVYGLSVAKVNTLNVEGKKKRGKAGFFRWVALRPLLGARQLRLCADLQGQRELAGMASCPRILQLPVGLPLAHAAPSTLRRRPDYKKAFVVLNEPSSSAKA